MTSTRTVTEIIPAALAGERIDRVVALACDVSRSQAVGLIQAGRVLVGGRVPDKPSQRVELDDVVLIDLVEQQSDLQPDESVPVDVVYSDDDVVVVDKRSGIVVHPGSGVMNGTLVQGLLSRFASLRSMIDDAGDDQRPGIVHRLDRGTSGLLVVALNLEAQRHLIAQFAARSVGRRYRALVVGDLESDAGRIDAPLGRSPKDPTVRAVVADGKPALTHYEVTARFSDPGCTLVDCRLETGRTHQIRAHFAAIGHPVVGDDRYGGGTLGLGLNRPFLHAAELAFSHPRTGDRIEFESPLPDDLQVVLDELSSDQDA